MIFDEMHYVPSLHAVLRGSSNTNLEHPPLAKLFMSLGTLIFWDNYDIGPLGPPTGWRIFSVFFGLLSLVFFYALILSQTKNQTLALYSSALLAFENLFFITSSIGILDIFFITFMTLSFLLFFMKHNFLSALSMSLALSCKLSAVMGVLIILVYGLVHFFKFKKVEIINLLKRYSSWLTAVCLLFLVLLPTFALIAYRNTSEVKWSYAYSSSTNEVTYLGWYEPNEQLSYLNPLKYISRMIVIASLLKVKGGITSKPWDWLLNPFESKINYYSANATGGFDVFNQNIRYTLYEYFIGCYTPLVVLFLFISIPYLAYSYYKFRRELDLFMLVWFLVGYFIWFPVALSGRSTYLFYILPVIPPICYANIDFLLKHSSKSIAKWYVILNVLVFIVLFYPLRVWDFSRLFFI